MMYCDYLKKVDLRCGFSITTSAIVEDEGFYVDGDAMREAEEIFRRHGRWYSDFYGATIPLDIWIKCLEEWKKECQNDKRLAEVTQETLDILCWWTERNKGNCEEVCLYDMLK